MVDLVLTGADRIAANGDTANKIGTYGRALPRTRTAFPSTSRRRSARSTARPPPAPGSDRGALAEEVLSVEGVDDAGAPARVRIAPRGRRRSTRRST